MNKAADDELNKAVAACRAAADETSDLNSFRIRILLQMLQLELEQDQRSFRLKTLLQMLQKEIEEDQRSRRREAGEPSQSLDAHPH